MTRSEENTDLKGPLGMVGSAGATLKIVGEPLTMTSPARRGSAPVVEPLAKGPGLNDGPKGPLPGREIPGCGVLSGMPENVWELPCSRLRELPAAEGGTENFGRELPDELGAPPDVTSRNSVWGPFLPQKVVFAAFGASLAACVPATGLVITTIHHPCRVNAAVPHSVQNGLFTTFDAPQKGCFAMFRGQRSHPAV
ncbi:hypothetical protein C8J57DRAFT_1235038 [Mycena rebaudengoi]|nr:hypothetical protein C8J57DRAFT_1235038 [Mycena rebaudengoi]